MYTLYMCLCDREKVIPTDSAIGDASIASFELIKNIKQIINLNLPLQFGGIINAATLHQGDSVFSATTTISSGASRSSSPCRGDGTTTASFFLLTSS